jgi:hypothetical protein
VRDGRGHSSATRPVEHREPAADDHRHQHEQSDLSGGSKEAQEAFRFELGWSQDLPQPGAVDRAAHRIARFLIWLLVFALVALLLLGVAFLVVTATLEGLTAP